ncbi:hypothetical protein RB628_09735 [Streptomyces sp. ADMS]|uniref:hypothetical protein n=1 Tax=Streptomyces sp. ADMS TaxID=3071415 RepID=UPI00296F7F2E|nr:hypothetical protein [Streptomyces sp. ADMS]MDW4905618.1 hypothetical protein [Streptomyces sp. ADMS]
MVKLCPAPDLYEHRDSRDQRPGTPSVGYRVHSDTIADRTAVPRFFAVDEFETAGLESARSWLDRALELEAEAGAHGAPGAVSGHVHVSGDGHRMRNLSAWVSSTAHEEFLTGGALAQMFAMLGPPGTPCGQQRLPPGHEPHHGGPLLSVLIPSTVRL